MAKSTKIGRDSSNGQFVLGVNRFSRISAVEGISPSKRLKEDLRKLRTASSDNRRAVLAESYGNKK